MKMRHSDIRKLLEFDGSLINMIEGIIMICSQSAMVTIALVQVFSRYILQRGILWADEIILFLFVLSVFMGAPLAMRKGLHSSVTYFREKLAKKTANVIIIFNYIAMLLFLCILFIEGIMYAVHNLDQHPTTLAFSLFWPYLIVPVGALLFIIEIIRFMKMDIARFLKKQYSEKEAVDVSQSIF